MIVSIYIYDANNLIEKPCLTNNILEHTKRYNNLEKRRISESNYHMASLKLKDLGANLDSFRFINGKPVIDDYYISFSHNNSYYGFSISNLNHGLDFQRVLKERTMSYEGNGVKVSKVSEDYDTDFIMEYDPSHPDADENGYVSYPNVNTVTEMTNLIDASRSYEANTTAFQAMKSITSAGIQIGSR